MRREIYFVGTTPKRIEISLGLQNKNSPCQNGKSPTYNSTVDPFILSRPS